MNRPWRGLAFYSGNPEKLSRACALFNPAQTRLWVAKGCRKKTSQRKRVRRRGPKTNTSNDQTTFFEAISCARSPLHRKKALWNIYFYQKSQSERIPNLRLSLACSGSFRPVASHESITKRARASTTTAHLLGS